MENLFNTNRKPSNKQESNKQNSDPTRLDRLGLFKTAVTVSGPRWEVDHTIFRYTENANEALQANRNGEITSVFPVWNKQGIIQFYATMEGGDIPESLSSVFERGKITATKSEQGFKRLNKQWEIKLLGNRGNERYLGTEYRDDHQTSQKPLVVFSSESLNHQQVKVRVK